MAVAPSARPRKSRSMRTAAPRSDAARLAVVMKTPKRGSGTEAYGLLQIVPFRARGFNRSASIAGPLDHRAGIEPGLCPPEQFVQDEPIGRGPVARIAVADGRTGRNSARNRSKFRLRLQAVRLRVVEFGAVEAYRSGNVAIGLRRRRLFLAVEERSRARIDQRRTAFAFDRLDIIGQCQNAVIDRRREDFRRWRLDAALDREARL